MKRMSTRSTVCSSDASAARRHVAKRRRAGGGPAGKPPALRWALRGRLPGVVSIDPRFALAAASDDIERIYAKQRANRDRVAATSAAERIEKLRRFHAAIFAHRAEFYGALWADYQKPA